MSKLTDSYEKLYTDQIILDALQGLENDYSENYWGELLDKEKTVLLKKLIKEYEKRVYFV